MNDKTTPTLPVRYDDVHGGIATDAPADDAPPAASACDDGAPPARD